MSLVPANIEVFAAAFQDDRDTPASLPEIAWSLEDAGFDPGVTSIVTTESDQSAQEGERVIVGAEPGGTFKKYARPTEEDFFLAALLGSTEDTGSDPTTHISTIDPDAPFTTPYLTLWDIWPGIVTVRYSGVRLASAVFSSAPGQAVSVDYTGVALAATFVEEPSLDGLFVDELPYTWPELSAKLGGDDPKTINNLSLSISRGTSRYPGDNGLTSFDLPNGLVAITGSLELAFEDDDLFRAANTGTVDGDDLTTTIYDTTLEVALTRSADLSIDLAVAGVQITNYRKALKTDASPATATFDFSAKRNSAIEDLIVSTIKNAAPFASRSGS